MKLTRKERKEIKRKNKLQNLAIDQKTSYLFLDDQDESVVGKGLGDIKSFKVLLSYAKSFKWEFIFSLSLLLISSTLAIYSSKLIGDLVQNGLMALDLNASISYAVAIVTLEIFSILFIWLGTRKLANASSKVIFLIRRKLFAKLQDLPLQYYDRQPQGRIVTRVTHDVEGIEEFFTSGLGNLISALMMTTLALGAMLVSNLKLGTMMVISIIPALVVIYKTKDLLRMSNRRVSKYSSAINSKLSEYLNGIETIRSFGLEKWSMTNFKETIINYRVAQLNGNFLFSWSTPLVSFAITIPLLGLVWFGGKGVISGAYTVGLFVSFIRFYERFSSPMMMLAREIHVVQQAFSSTERVMNFLNEDDEDNVLISEGHDVVKYIHGDIKFQNVYMKYLDGDWVLKNLSFHIKSGQKIGLVGKTGCGKSSTVSLLSRLYEFQKGDILLDDKSIREYDRHHLRSKIGFVSQDAIIFKGSLRENLTSDDRLSDLEIVNACKETGLFKALSKEGFNLNLEVLENGANLSVGQKQLVSLTRVLIQNPSILILDEATANIDPYYEEIIQRAVYKIMDARTCLMIAHRLETLNECDKILVFNDGELIEEGSIDELFNNKNYFYNLHHAQEIQL